MPLTQHLMTRSYPNTNFSFLLSAMAPFILRPCDADGENILSYYLCLSKPSLSPIILRSWSPSRLGVLRNGGDLLILWSPGRKAGGEGEGCSKMTCNNWVWCTLIMVTVLYYSRAYWDEYTRLFQTHPSRLDAGLPQSNEHTTAGRVSIRSRNKE